ncbi:MAG TPA: YbhB/YbcL family Raf kinase inhibitor-like protein [Actinopolymorphaceae bacterium]
MELRTSAFDDHTPIPAVHTRDGDNVSPPLEWSGVPEGTVELALICEDPDAPSGTFVHWVVAGIPPDVDGFAHGEVPSGTVAGRNDFGDVGWGGPRPPVGDPAHRYFVRLYALDTPTELEPGFDADELRRHISRHAIDSGNVVGLYQR